MTRKVKDTPEPVSDVGDTEPKERFTSPLRRRGRGPDTLLYSTTQHEPPTRVVSDFRDVGEVRREEDEDRKIPTKSSGTLPSPPSTPGRLPRPGLPQDVGRAGPTRPHRPTNVHGPPQTQLVLRTYTV